MTDGKPSWVFQGTLSSPCFESISGSAGIGGPGINKPILGSDNNQPSIFLLPREIRRVVSSELVVGTSRRVRAEMGFARRAAWNRKVRGPAHDCGTTR